MALIHAIILVNIFRITVSMLTGQTDRQTDKGRTPDRDIIYAFR